MKKLVAYLLILLTSILLLSACETQYERDLRSAAGKSWGEMTSRERKATRDVIEWKISESMKNGDW